MVKPVAETVRAAAQPLPDIDSEEFASFFDKFGDSRVVLIGDSSHGTSEFYRARAAITQHLINHHDFTIIALEADWPDAATLDRYVRQPKRSCAPPLQDPKLRPFNHFPRWMWRNNEVSSFINWLRTHNASLPHSQRAGVHGLDLYSMGASIKAVTKYLDDVDPETAAVARERYSCLEPWAENPARYGRVALNKGYAPCEPGVVAMLRDLLSKRLEFAAKDGGAEGSLDAEMNARVVRDSEQYYRAMYYGDAESWNLRDTHMFRVLQRLLKAKPGAKAVVWAHNSHLGDARATGMGENTGEINLGQLCREHFQEGAGVPGAVSIIGCGTHGGDGSTVAAAEAWDGRMRVMPVKPGREDSYERVMHEAGFPSFLLDLRPGQGKTQEKARMELMQPRLERFIGVVYRPETERWSHYQQACLPKQFDAFVWFDRSSAVKAFETAQPDEPPAKGETYPFGY